MNALVILSEAKDPFASGHAGDGFFGCGFGMTGSIRASSLPGRNAAEMLCGGTLYGFGANFGR